MKRAAILALAGFATLACGETDVDGARQMQDTVPEVQPVDLDTVAWFVEGRTVDFDGRTWLIAGEPVIDPVVERVGEFEGTPLYAELNTMEPYNELFIPLENDYWQLLEEGPAVPADTAAEPTDTVSEPDTAGADTLSGAMDGVGGSG